MISPTELLYAALGARIGIVVETDDREGLRQALYSARVQAKDPDLALLSILVSPTNAAQLWIIKKEFESAQDSP